MNQITFISNCGIQIELDDIVIWADPFCKNSSYLWMDTSPEVEAALETYQLPLKKPDLLLLSHIHNDHYNRDFTGKLLMQNPEQVVAKLTILERISDDTPDCTEDSLKIHIHNLRRKLKAVTGKEYISAVWGIGFMLTEKS